ncbi:uncharacterized protein LOC115953086 isoform X3 [Quercus lobata]|uniref:uncharacterized protein LOC115953086 isoform X3 n=1 Tax=Quercus lobata TaxID=97700 RepID=UPI001245348A|nr:uncharacterized protein LOC115953086 isoform X3 [Quercus lobata]
MGDLRAWSPEPPNTAVLEERLSSSSSSSSSSNQTAGIAAESLQRAEEATQGIIAQVQPTVVSENRRRAVTDYVQRLLRTWLGCEVFPFGSVPLKTYLPDGDIDLTAFGLLNGEEALASNVCSVLEREDQNRAAEFVVKDVQMIRAEVKLVKCLVQNIVVDISFNQLGGLCTLCFLEKVDRLIGKDHLFKRSIILIKAWCYYESRILGAHHGLISTYALETLVLYIFHLFHASLNGPLAVLYKFLDHFSKFDWDNYCISLTGPVRLSSLPELVAETPENDGTELLLSNDFFKECLEMFSVPARGYDTNSRTFPPKHFNIVDPLKENNNLGRSVSKGNFYRIRSAFTYGARKLGHILSQQEANIEDEIRRFFSNTLDRHGSGQRPDVQDPVPMPGHNVFGIASSFSGTGTSSAHAVNEPKRSSVDASGSTMLSEADGSVNGITVSEHRLVGDAKDLATSRIQDLTISNDAIKSLPSSCKDGTSSLGKAHHAPPLYFSQRVMGNGDGDGNPDRKQPEESGCTEKKDSPRLLQAPSEEKALIVHLDQYENQLVSDNDSLSPVGLKHHSPRSSLVTWSSEDLYPNYSNYWVLNGSSGNPEVLNHLSDLSGDQDSHINSLNYGIYRALSTAVTPVPLLFPQHHGKKSWDVIRQSVQLNRNVFSQMNTNGVVPRAPFYPMNPTILPGGVAFGMEEMPKPRGTGTYFPNTNHYRDRPLTPRGRNQAPVRSPRNNGRATSIAESSWSERSSRELAQAQFPVYGGGKSGSSDHTSGSPGRKLYSNANGSMHPSEGVVEFGSIGHLPVEGSLPERSRQQNSGSAPAQNLSVSLLSPGIQSPKPVLGVNQDRIAQSFRLKDEEEFPPLSV